MPIRDLLQSIPEAEFVAMGPAGKAVEVAASLGAYEAEYAAIRKGVGVLHLPQRAVLRLTGSAADRKDFLHRMLTQDINGMAGGSTRRAFQINEKGRIVADVIVHHGDHDTWLETDVFDLPALQTLLEGRLFAEDVQVEDWTAQRTLIALHGPATLPVLQTLASPDPAAMFNMPGTHHVLTIAGAASSCYRWDDAGVPGVRMFVPPDAAGAVHAAILAASGYDPAAGADAKATEARRATAKGRPIGWLAYNTARIEAGSPLFHIDFGPDSLPAETGLLDQAVSFKKGCYLGQEIVARMQNLGHPRKLLVGLRLESDAMPIAGSQVFDAAETGVGSTSGAVVGAVTSSAVSPMLGGTAVAFAVMKWGRHQPGTRVAVEAEGQLRPATVGPLKCV